MTDIVDHVRDILETAGLEVGEVRELPTGLGWQVRCTGGEMVCAYRTGKMVAQGRNASMVKALLEKVPLKKAGPMTRAAAPGKPATPQPAPPHGCEDEPYVPRRHPDWTEAPWDGVSVPW